MLYDFSNYIWQTKLNWNINPSNFKYSTCALVKQWKFGNHVSFSNKGIIPKKGDICIQLSGHHSSNLEQNSGNILVNTSKLLE